MSKWSYRPELDGLRSVAVYLVLLFHSGTALAGGGFIGVDLFFVLSGFLVTQVIWAEVEERGTFSLGRFYARRVRRLLPAAVVVIVATSLVQLLVASQPQRLEWISDGRSALLYVANWDFISDSRDYFAADIDKSPFLHFWSLSIEEQFYIGMPLVLLLIVRFARHRRRVLIGVMSAVVLVSLGLQMWQADRDATYAYYASETRLYQLAAGVLLAAVTGTMAGRGSGQWFARVADGRLAGAAAMGGVLAVVLLGAGIPDVSPSSRGALATAASVLAIAGLQAAPGSLVARLLALPIPRYLGQISYSTYLWHWPTLLLLMAVFDVEPLVLALLGGLVATGLAALSYQVLEQPIRRAAFLNALRWPVVATGLTVSVLVAAFVVPAVLDSENRPAVAGGGSENQYLGELARNLDKPIPKELDLAGAATDWGDQGLICTPDDVDACEVVSGDGLHVVLVGDSHAQMFATAFRSLAMDRDWRLSTGILPGCAWQLGLNNKRNAESEQEKCDVARRTFYTEVLPEMDADVVVAVSLSRTSKKWKFMLTADDAPEGETLEQRQLRTADETVKAVREAGPRLVLVKSLMSTEGYDVGGFSPLDCLARAKVLSDCTVVQDMVKPTLDGLYDTIATTADGVATVDLNPVLCPGTPLCSPVVDGTVVWRSADHVSATYLDEHRDELWKRIEDTGILE